MPATRLITRASASPGSVFLLVVLLLVASWATVTSRVSAKQDPGADPRLESLRGAIERAFRDCDTAPLKGSLSRRVKIFLSSRALGVRQGYYGADQVQLILRRAFEDRMTVRFRLERGDDPAPREGRLTLSARWLYRDEGASKSEARLSFILVREGSVWSIREIRELK